jgi:hypothetical protein
VAMDREDWWKLLKKARGHTGLSSQWWWRWHNPHEDSGTCRIVWQVSVCLHRRNLQSAHRTSLQPSSTSSSLPMRVPPKYCFKCVNKEPGPDCREDPVFQVLSDEGRAPFLPSLNIRHYFLTYDTFIALHCNQLTVNFNRTDILCIQKPN